MAHRHDQPPPRPPWGGPGWGPRPGWVPPWAAGGWGPPGPQSGPTGIRIGNAERTEVTNALVRHMAEGRLTEEELEERLAQANAAKTAEDLRPLLADLPPLDGNGEDAPAPPRRRRRPTLLWVLVAVAALWALGAAAAFARHAVFLPPFPLIVVAIVIVVLLRRRRCRPRQ